MSVLVDCFRLDTSDRVHTSEEPSGKFKTHYCFLRNLLFKKCHEMDFQAFRHCLNGSV